MAEYYPLLDRAVAALTDPTPEARQSIYDRARKALIGQLRSVQPPIPEADIQRENTALDEAIARIEARFAPAASAGRPTSDGPKAAPSIRPAPAARPAPSPRPGPSSAGAPPVVPPPIRDRPIFAPRPQNAPSTTKPADANPEPAPTPPGARSPNIRPSAPLAKPSGAAGLKAGPAAPVRPVTPGGRQATTAGPAAPVRSAPPGAGEATTAGPATPVLPVAPTLSLSPTDAESDAAVARPASDAATADRPEVPDPPRAREDAMRPPAPRGIVDEPRPLARWILGGLALGIVCGIGVAAWKLRDRPEQIVAAQRAPTPADAPDKIVGRADSSGAGEAPSNPDKASGASVPAPLAQGETPATALPAGATAPSTPAPAADNPPIAVSQRAALLVDAPEEPQKVKTYEGTVVWHTESVSPGQGQPLATAVQADVEIPAAKLQMRMILQKNVEAQLPASHTLELRFTPEPGNTIGGVKQINVPEMRKDEDPTGTPLTGVPVAITDNNFLVGLSRGAAEAQNLKLLLERNWFDVSVLLLSGKVGKITFEKGATGQRTLEDASKSWQ